MFCFLFSLYSPESVQVLLWGLLQGVARYGQVPDSGATVAGIVKISVTLWQRWPCLWHLRIHFLPRPGVGSPVNAQGPVCALPVCGGRVLRPESLQTRMA